MELKEKYCVTMKGFSQTNEALEILEEALHCSSCRKYMKVPVNVWSCVHIFCRNCIGNISTCPDCSVPICWLQDVKENRRLETISSLCQNLRKELHQFSNQSKLTKKCNEPKPQNKMERDISMSSNAQTKTKLRKGKINKKINGSLCKKKSVTVTQKHKIIGKKAETISKFSVTNSNGETPLHIAAIQNNIEEVERLISNDVNVNTKDNAGWTPLHEACNRGHLQIVEKLLDADALIDVPGYENETPLMDAVMNNKTETVKLLMERGANINLRNIHGKTALSFVETSKMEKLFLTFIPKQSDEAAILENTSLQAQCLPVIATSTSVNVEKLKTFCKFFKATTALGNAIDATHYVVKSNPSNNTKRTLKYLQAMASGAWIVNEQWLDACIEQNAMLQESDFLLSGSCEDETYSGPLRSIAAKLKYLPRLFNGCHFFLSGNFAFPLPTKQQIIELIKAADGKILNREPKPDSDIVQMCRNVPYHANPDSSEFYFTYYIVYDQSQRILPRMTHKGKVCTVPVTWLLSCLAQFMLCKVFQ